MPGDPEQATAEQDANRPEAIDPNDTNRLQEQIRGQTKEHASPPRLEDEGQSGG